MSREASEKSGSCLCGAVRYRVAGPMRQVISCHCSQCRKQTGHYLAATGALMKYFELIEQRGLQWYRATEKAKRGFCGICGSTMFWLADGADRISIAAGSLDGESGLSTAAQIFVADKGDYYDLDEGPPQYAAGGCQVPMPE